MNSQDISAPEWSALFAMPERGLPKLVVREVLKVWSEQEARSRPMKVLADDGKRYVIKGIQTDRNGRDGRRLWLEQIVGHLGYAMGAPVSKVRIVDVPEELTTSREDIPFLRPGPCHGSEFIPNCDTCPKHQMPTSLDMDENRLRLGLLSVLFGWISLTAEISEPQILVERKPPHLIHSIDHGLLSSRVPIWDDHNGTGGSFDEYWRLSDSWVAKPVRRLYRSFITSEWDNERDFPELREACQRLDGIPPETIAAAVVSAPDEWGITTEDQIKFAMYLGRRQAELIRWPT